MISDTGVNRFAESDAAWRMLSTIMVVEGADSRRRIIEQIAVSAQELDLPVNVLAQLRLAMLEAIENIPDRGSAPSLLIVRLFVRGMTTPDVARLAATSAVHKKSSEGWGFFLVQKCADVDAQAAGAGVDVIELYLYQEWADRTAAAATSI